MRANSAHVFQVTTTMELMSSVRPVSTAAKPATRVLYAPLVIVNVSVFLMEALTVYARTDTLTLELRNAPSVIIVVRHATIVCLASVVPVEEHIRQTNFVIVVSGFMIFQTSLFVGLATSAA